MKKSKDMSIGTRYNHLIYGIYDIISYSTQKHVKIRFLKTGCVTKTRADRVRSGNVVDRMQSKNCSEFFIGIGEYKSKDGAGRTIAYERWRKMIARCTDVKYQERYPTYKGCTVCDEWHNFQNFAKWHEINYPSDGGNYHLDKDIKVKGNKIYSPLTCMYVTPSENAAQAAKTRRVPPPELRPTVKRWRFIDPEGRAVEFVNLNEFCRGKGLNASHMGAVHSGKRKRHRGWRK